MRTFEGEWSEDNQVFYYEEGAWGVNKTGKTVWLGKEDDIIKTHPIKGARIRTRKPSNALEWARKGIEGSGCSVSSKRICPLRK